MNRTPESRELAMFTINNPGVHRNQMEATVILLQSKYRKGTFDKTKALRSISLVVNTAAKEYTKAHCSPGDGWDKIFKATDRDLSAMEVLEYYMEQIEEESQ